MEKISLSEKLSEIIAYWKPFTVTELNGQEVRLAKFFGSFIWHSHDNEDELFLCLSGKLRIELRDRVVELSSGELFVVPRGAEHRTSADEEAHVLLFEPKSTRNTGNVYESELSVRSARI